MSTKRLKESLLVLLDLVQEIERLTPVCDCDGVAPGRFHHEGCPSGAVLGVLRATADGFKYRKMPRDLRIREPDIAYCRKRIDELENLTTSTGSSTID